jgi:hypothetical protein
MKLTAPTRRQPDPDAPELRYYDLYLELDALARYVIAVALAPYAPVIHLDVMDLESRSTWRRWGPDERRSPERTRNTRRRRGRRAEDRVPVWAMA